MQSQPVSQDKYEYYNSFGLELTNQEVNWIIKFWVNFYTQMCMNYTYEPHVQNGRRTDVIFLNYPWWIILKPAKILYSVTSDIGSAHTPVDGWTQVKLWWCTSKIWYIT